eukprot:COSAG03_NODE_769_length_5929_cov_381.464666_4_plen_129_part_00
MCAETMPPKSRGQGRKRREPEPEPQQALRGGFERWLEQELEAGAADGLPSRPAIAAESGGERPREGGTERPREDTTGMLDQNKLERIFQVDPEPDDASCEMYRLPAANLYCLSVSLSHTHSFSVCECV